MSSGAASQGSAASAASAALRDRRELTVAEIGGFMSELMAGRLATADVIEVLELLRAKGETAGEITEAARVMRSHGIRVNTGLPRILDTCGTGGDGSCTVSVSTIVALIAAAAGVPVAKHGNRSASSKWGSADFLSEIGIPIEAEADKLVRGLKETNFAFFYARSFHPSMKHAAEARKEIKGRTIFNCIGPLTNPAGATHQLVGVNEERLVPLMAEALGALGAVHAIVVHSNDGIDEVSPTAFAQVAEWTKGKLIRWKPFNSEEAGVKRLTGGRDLLKSADIASAVREGLEIINGAPGPKTELVVLNAGFALKAADEAVSISEGVEMARNLLSSGAVRQKMDQIKAFYGKN